MTVTTDAPGRVQDAYPLAALQAGMVYHSVSEPSAATFHDLITLTLRGRFEESSLAGALEEVAARHPVLRTSFDLAGFSEPLQLVHETVRVPLDITDLTGSSEAAEELRRWREAETHRPFDWGVPPLLRTHVHLLPEAHFALSVSFHHAILDGWSVATLVTELVRRYVARLDGTPLPAQPPAATFRELVARERAAMSSAAAAFWRERVGHAPATVVPRWPHDGRLPAKDPAVRVLARRLDADLVVRLEGVARSLGVPLRTVLLTAHLRVLGLVTGDREVMTGLVVHNRPEDEAGGEVLGLFLNTVPLHVSLDASTWADLVGEVFAQEVALLPHRTYPLFEIQRLAGRSPLLDTLFDFRDFHVYRDLEGIEVVGHEFFEQIDLAFAAAFARSPTDGGIDLAISYDRSQFPDRQVEDIADLYLRALSGIDPDRDPRPTNRYLAGRHTERVAGWNATGVEYGASCLGEVVSGSVGLWLGEVRAPVGVLLERGEELVGAVHGVVAAGGAYVPLEPGYPDERLALMVGDAGVEVVVTSRALADRVPAGVEALYVEEAERGRLEWVPVDAGALAYVMFTSGSTGRPKGVGVSHGAIVNRLLWMQDAFGLGGEDRVLFKTPFSFDVSVWELFWPFMAGAGLVIAEPGGHRDSAYLAGLMRDEGVTTVHFVPSMLEVLLEEPGLVGGDLRRVICSGEALSPAVCERFFERLPGVELHNLYGPTEAAVDVSWHVCRPGERRVPIGRPVANTRLEVLDDRMERVPVGARGELCIGGVQLARGYVNRPGLTAERFVPDPFCAGERLYRTGDLAAWRPDGEIEYLGRTDDQLKIRGMRVEPGEVAAALTAQPEVRSAVVVAREGRLVAYLVTDAEDVDWRGRLRATLPEHMIPGAYVPIEAIPTTANGKLDRTRLPAPVTRPGGRDPVPPRDPIEARLALLFEETLGVDIVGVHDDFFELGGHSLLTLRLTMRIRQELGRDLPVATVLTSPTVAGLAAVLRRPGDGAPPTRIVPLRETGERTPIFLVHALGGEVFRYMPLVRRLGADQPVFGIAARGLADGEEPHATLADMVDDYAGHIRTVRPRGPYVLGGYCIGGNIALEVARRLRVEGAPVPLVAMFYSDADEPVVRSSLDDDDALTRHALAGAPLDDLDVDQDALDDLGPDERLAALMNAAARRDLQPEAADLEQARRYLRVFRANAHAVGHVRHEPYDGRVALFAPTDDRGVADELGWRAVVTGRLAVAPIPGDRFHILYEPLVADAAAELRGWMDRDDAD